MPKTTKSGGAKKDELPSTLRRSSPKAQRTFAKAHDAAAEQYGSEERAHRVAYAAVKHSYEKVGDHWEAKERRAPRTSGQKAAAPTTTCPPPKASTQTRARSTCSTSRVDSMFGAARR